MFEYRIKVTPTRRHHDGTIAAKDEPDFITVFAGTHDEAVEKAKAAFTRKHNNSRYVDEFFVTNVEEVRTQEPQVTELHVNATGDLAQLVSFMLKPVRQSYGTTTLRGSA